MARLLVVDSEAGTETPFLRGILTRSLQDAGLSFDDAYELASTMREELADREEISIEKLRAGVARHLSVRNPVIAERYLQPRTAIGTIQVLGWDEQLSPFSRAQHRNDLEVCGLSSDEAASITERIFDEIVEEGLDTIEAGELARRTHERLKRDLGKAPARHYLVWREFQASDRPLMIFVGGVVGSGKSTIATALAHRLGIVRIQSMDMLREMMRLTLPSRLLPVLHRSSYNAWQALPGVSEDEPATPERIVEGYLTQVELLSVAAEAVLHRARRERVSIILEGVHVHPGLVELPQHSDALTVSFNLSVLRPKRLKKRITGRGRKNPDRRAERYLAHFDEIWQLQTHLLEEADRLSAPVIDNQDRDRTVAQALQIVLQYLSEHFSGRPAAVFGPSAPRSN